MNALAELPTYSQTAAAAPGIGFVLTAQEAGLQLHWGLMSARSI